MALLIAILVGIFGGFWPAFATFWGVLLLQFLCALGEAGNQIGKRSDEW